jgi:uncharacterized protein (DUF1501 family)
MAHSHRSNRRDFLKLSSQLAALGLTSLTVGRAKGVFAATLPTPIDVTDYKALVCIYLFGGNDANNLIVPVDNTRYPQYQSLRGGLALGAGKLLPAIADGHGNPYALHYGLTEMNPIYNAGHLAVVLNMGVLQQPLTKAQYQAGLQTPTNLFSHSDQTVQTQTGMPTANGTGWGGRLIERFGSTDTLSAVSLSSPALFLQGFNSAGNSIPPNVTLNLSGMNFWPSNQAAVRQQALDTILTQDGGNVLRQTANQMFADGLHLAQTLQSAPPGSNAFFPSTDLGNQLKQVWNLIALRSQQGPGRQVFFCSLGMCDTHSGQDYQQWYNLSTLSQAMSALYDASTNAGLGASVTTFTQSEFGRTLQPSGTGSDHAWGSHHLVMGGAVQGGIYGQYPTLALGGPDDANTRGVWIPTISTAQFGATLGKWFGAAQADLDAAFPNLSLFPTGDLGFMG